MPTFDTLIQLWDRARTSLWFVPGILGLAALTLAGSTPAIDRAVPDEWLLGLPLVYSGQPIGARAVLTTIATSMIATAGVVFSMTIVSLQLASSQFGPRLLRTFLRDAGNQVVLGTYIGTFLYCILVLPTIDSTADSVFVPHIAVSMAVLLAIVCLGMLVYFIDHVAQSINADAVIHAVNIELEEVIDNIFPEPLGESADDDDVLPPADDKTIPIYAENSGYLSFVNGDVILQTAMEHDLFVRLATTPGQFILEGDLLARVTPPAKLDDQGARCIREAFVLAMNRTPLQDVTFAFEQLSEMAVRALSPGINDPTTAVHCIDRIGSGLARLVSRRRPRTIREDEAGAPRIYAEPVGLQQILTRTVEPIARNAADQLIVWLRLLAVLEKTCERSRRPDDRELLRNRAGRVESHARTIFKGEHDRNRLSAAVAWV